MLWMCICENMRCADGVDDLIKLDSPLLATDGEVYFG
jgi:hypothetical protein